MLRIHVLIAFYIVVVHIVYGWVVRAIFVPGSGLHARLRRSPQEDYPDAVPDEPRSFQEEHLDDPDHCIYKCWAKEKSQSEQVTEDNANRVAETVLLIIANNTNMTRSDPLPVEQTEQVSVDTMAPTFYELCSISWDADHCFERCPQSKLRNMIQAMRFDRDLFCEARKNWKSFKECHSALKCINHTLQHSECEKKCGQILDARSYVDLSYHNASNCFLLQYDENAVGQLGSICQSNSCHLDCSKAAIVDHCGMSAFGTHLRFRMAEVKALLMALKEVDSVNPMKECRRFVIF